VKRIGVFVCHCGINIASTVDPEKVIEEVKKHPNVAYATNYVYMCSDPGQDIINKAIKEHNLDGVVVAACSPTLHQNTFRKLIARAGLNYYQHETANIREQCSWVHKDKGDATAKAVKIALSAVEKVLRDENLQPISVPVTKKALVIGGGIAGIQAALDIANAGHEVLLVEKQPSIGGHMAQLSETFPTLDCSQCIMTPRMVEVGQHPNITLMTNSEVEEVGGYVGNFKVRIKRNPTYIDWSKCTGCGLCAKECRLADKIPDNFNCGLTKRGAAYIMFPQAVPLKAVIDPVKCLMVTRGKCGDEPKCLAACSADAINFDMKEEIIEEEVGAVVVATGYELYPTECLGEYGYGKIPDVIDGLTFERILSASGPTDGEVRRPSDGQVPKEMVFVQCAGSRDKEFHKPYCSKICCMYTAKHAMLYKHNVHDGQAYVFYIDVRTGGKGYEEFYDRTTEEERVVYLRGKVSRIFQEGGKVMVWGIDTLTGKKVEIAADMVVLAMAMVPQTDAKELASKLKIQVDQDNWLSEAHPKLRPVETLTSGVFVAGAAQAPKDIPETVAQASGAASKVLGLFSKDTFERDPLIAGVDEELCVGCGVCVEICPYGARELDPARHVVVVNPVLCEGCGACATACPSGAITHANFSAKQILNMITPFLEK
jgi:heterodisulfide reductase subunit A